MSVVVVKSSFEDGSLRRHSHNAEKPKFSRLETSLRTIHGISPDIPIIIAYQDADGDAVTIDSTRELTDALRPLVSSGASLRIQVSRRALEDDDFELVRSATSSEAGDLMSESEDEDAQKVEVCASSVAGTTPGDTSTETVTEDAATTVLAAIDAGTSHMLSTAEASIAEDDLSILSRSIGIVSPDIQGSLSTEPAVVDEFPVLSPMTSSVPAVGPDASFIEIPAVQSPVEGPVNSQPERQGQADDVAAFIAEVTPMINFIVEKLEAKPHLVPLLGSMFPETLLGHKFGLKIDDGSQTSNAPTFSQGSTVHHHHRPHGHHHGDRPHCQNRRNDSGFVWRGVVCDNCGQSNFSGPRYKCFTCKDFDLCSTCWPLLPFTESVKSHTDHKFFELNDDSQLHRGISCDACGRSSIVGSRFKCVDCHDYDLCAVCIHDAAAFHRPGHWFNRYDSKGEAKLLSVSGGDILRGPMPTSSVFQTLTRVNSVKSSTPDATAPVYSPPVSNTSSTVAVESASTKPASPTQPLPRSFADVASSFAYARNPSIVASSSSSSSASSHASTSSQEYSSLNNRVAAAITATDDERLSDFLTEMVCLGFDKDLDLLTRLFRRYNGDVSRCVEILLRKDGQLDDEEYFF